MLEAALLAGAWLAAVPAPVFAPVADRPYRYATVETRGDGAAAYVFTVERRLVFHRDGAGWTATVTLERYRADAPAPMARGFTAGLAPLAGRPVRYHLDAAGGVTGVDDEAELWSGLAAAVAPPGAAAMRAVTPERRRAMFASVIEAVVAVADAARPPAPPRPVRLPGRLLAGRRTELAGTEQVALAPDGTVQRSLHAAGDPEPGLHADVVMERRVDRSTGLVVAQHDTTMLTGAGPATRTETSTSVTLVP